MRGYYNCMRRYTEYCIDLNSKKYIKYICLGYLYKLAVWVQDLDKINKKIVKL